MDHAADNDTLWLREIKDNYFGYKVRVTLANATDENPPKTVDGILLDINCYGEVAILTGPKEDDIGYCWPALSFELLAE